MNFERKDRSPPRNARVRIKKRKASLVAVQGVVNKRPLKAEKLRGELFGNSFISQINVGETLQSTPASSEASSGGNHLTDLAFSGNIDSAPQNIGMMCLEIFATNSKNPKKMPVADKDPIEMICLVIETDDGNSESPFISSATT